MQPPAFLLDRLFPVLKNFLDRQKFAEEFSILTFFGKGEGTDLMQDACQKYGGTGNMKKDKARGSGNEWPGWLGSSP